MMMMMILVSIQIVMDIIVISIQIAWRISSSAVISCLDGGEVGQLERLENLLGKGMLGRNAAIHKAADLRIHLRSADEAGALPARSAGGGSHRSRRCLMG